MRYGVLTVVTWKILDYLLGCEADICLSTATNFMITLLLVSLTVRSSETSVNLYHTTGRNIPEHGMPTSDKSMFLQIKYLVNDVIVQNN
jgi:hypothetical protein